MLPLIRDLYQLSDNAPLFDQLRTREDLATLGERVGDAPSVPSRTVIGELLQAFRGAVIPALQEDDFAGLVELLEGVDNDARVVVLGELILTLYALTEGQHGGQANDVLSLAFNLVRDLARVFEAEPPQDAGDEQLWGHAVAMREWAHLLAGYYQLGGMDSHYAELLMIRARVTNCTLSAWPHLVGAAMVEVALALEPIGMLDMAIGCYEGVRMDLGYLVDRVDDPAFPEYEKQAALYWLQRACEEFCRLVPEDAEAARQLQEVRELREARGYPDDVSAPRFGSIAKTYLSRTPWLAMVLRALQENSEDIPAICQRYGCSSRDVEFYLSAMGSYVVRDTILQGFSMHYDEPHLAVFEALDYLKQHPSNE